MQPNHSDRYCLRWCLAVHGGLLALYLLKIAAA